MAGVIGEQVQEKEARIRVMMRMMGLGTAAYWAINYAFWVAVYVLFAVAFSAIAVAVQLPSGYRIGLFTRQVKRNSNRSNATEATVSPIDTFSPAATRATLPSLPRPTAATSPISDPNTPPPSTIPQSYSAAPQPLPPSPTVAKPTAIPMPSAAPTTPQMNNQGTTVQVTPKSTAIEPSGAALYVLINGLNVRTKPDLKAKSMGKLKLHDQVSFMHEVTDIAQPVRLADGTTISKPWFKIKTKRGTIGWVHGSGVDFYKRKPSEGL